MPFSLAFYGDVQLKNSLFHSLGSCLIQPSAFRTQGGFGNRRIAPQGRIMKNHVKPGLSLQGAKMGIPCPFWLWPK